MTLNQESMPKPGASVQFWTTRVILGYGCWAEIQRFAVRFKPRLKLFLGSEQFYRIILLIQNDAQYLLFGQPRNKPKTRNILGFQHD